MNQARDSQSGSPIRVRLLGDHSRVHGGCRAVWEVMLRAAKRQGLDVVETDYDALIVNGEGSMHHDRISAMRKLEALKEAVDTGKKAWLINTVWQEMSHDYDAVLQALDGVIVREPLSREALRAHGVEASVKPDLSFFHAARDPQVLSDFKGQPVMTDFWSDSFDAFARPTSSYLKDFRFFEFLKYDWAGAIESLKTTPLLITGRQHAVYAACKARTPFLAVKGNTHKIEGLVAMAGADIPVLDHPREIRDHLDKALENQSEYDRLFDYLDAQKRRGAFPRLRAEARA